MGVLTDHLLFVPALLFRSRLELPSPSPSESVPSDKSPLLMGFPEKMSFPSCSCARLLGETLFPSSPCARKRRFPLGRSISFLPSFSLVRRIYPGQGSAPLFFFPEAASPLPPLRMIFSPLSPSPRPREVTGNQVKGIFSFWCPPFPPLDRIEGWSFQFLTLTRNSLPLRVDALSPPDHAASLLYPSIP